MSIQQSLKLSSVIDQLMIVFNNNNNLHCEFA